MMVLIVLFILGIVGSANSESCTNYADIAPCDCQKEFFFKIKVTCESITLKELKQSMNALKGKKEVEIKIEGVKLGKIPSDLFLDIGVVSLKFSRCRIDSLTDNEDLPAFSGIKDTLQYLTIESSINEGNITTELKFGHLWKLGQFFFSRNTLKNLKNNMFEDGPASLVRLHFVNNKFEANEDRIFASLTNLKFLKLEGNQLGSIQRSILPSSADKLYSLDLGENELTSLPEDLFRDMPALNAVWLNSNKISRLEQNTWEPVWDQLDILYIPNNPLECDSHMSWMFEKTIPDDITAHCGGDKTRPLSEFIENKGE